MSWETGTAAGHAALLDKLNTFLVKGHSLPIIWTGTATGKLDNQIGTATSVQETITVTWTSATAFNVSGSVTGSMGSGTVGTPFSHARLGFTATAGGTAWSAGDTATFVMTPPWIQKEGSAGVSYIWQAPGNGNTDQIFVGATTAGESNATGGYYNWRLQGFTGWSNGAAFDAHPGAIAVPPRLPLSDQTITYWFFASGKRVVVVAKISTVYEFAYLGFLDAYMSPGQYAYPLVVSGSMAWHTPPAATSANWKWNYQGNEHAFGPMGVQVATYDDAHPLRMRKADGIWKGFGKAYTYAGMGSVFPYGNGMSNVRPNLDGGMPRIPIMLSDDGPNLYGELSGVVATTGLTNSAESTLTEVRDVWIVFQNVYRAGNADFLAVRAA